MIADLVRKLGAAGCTIEQIAVAVEMAEQEVTEKQQKRRRAAADRQARWRDKRHITPVGVTECDPPQHILPPQENSEPKKVLRSSRGTRIPADWTLTNADACFALPLIGEIRMAEEAAKFRDYWQARAGPGALKVDWGATWRGWIRNAGTKGNGNGRPNGTGVGRPNANGITGTANGDRCRELAELARQGEIAAGIRRPDDAFRGD